MSSISNAQRRFQADVMDNWQRSLKYDHQKSIKEMDEFIEKKIHPCCEMVF